jgi:hydroxyacylglutathione hydrolase
MIFERIKSEGIAHNSYFIGSGNSAAVIDPRRDVEVYLDLARRHGLVIRYIFETHRNEDYVIGSLELAASSGAAIYHGPVLDFKYGTVLQDGQEFTLGKIKLTALYTPGHSDDSLSYVLYEKSSGNSPVLVFTGDALFVNDSGRVDFGGPANVPRMASNLYDSLFKRLLPLGDGTIICPGHGAGSVCGSRIGERDESSLGIERRQNPALKLTEKESFVSYKASENHEKPPYFSRMEKYNLEGPPILGKLPAPPPLTPAEFKHAMEQGARVIDTRLPPAFGGAHIKGSCSIWLEGLPAFAGWFLPYDQPLLLLLEKSTDLEPAVRYLIRLGYDNLAGYLLDGIEAWYEAGFEVEKLELMTVQELKGRLEGSSPLRVLDVRSLDEWNSGHIAGARSIYVGYLKPPIPGLPSDQPLAVICTVGRRAGIACSLLQKAGYTRVFNVLGGMMAWHQAGFPSVTTP